MKFFFYFICLLYILSPANSEESYSKDIKNYFNSITIFKSEFYHIENSEISVGNLYFNEDRLRIEYLSPQNLIFVLKNKKVMFFNKELMEVNISILKIHLHKLSLIFLTIKIFLMILILAKCNNSY